MLSIKNSNFTNCFVEIEGGAIYIDNVTNVILAGSLFQNNMVYEYYNIK